MLKLRHAQLVRPLLPLVLCALFPATLIASDATHAAVGTTTEVRQSSPALLPAGNPYNRQLAELQRRMRGATPPETAVLLAQAYRLRDSIDDPAVLTRLLEQAAGDFGQHPLVRDEALRYLARIDLHNGELQAASAKLDALGFVRTWALAGPFAQYDASQSSAPGTIPENQHGLEQGFRASQTFRDKRGALRQARIAPPAGPQMWYDLARLYPHAAPAIVFASSFLYSDQPRQVALRFSAESAVTLFINGRQVFANRKGQGVGFDQHAVAVGLRSGWNALVLRLARENENPWRFALRVTELQGGGIALRASAEAPAGDDASRADATPGTMAIAADLVAMAKEAVTRNPASAAAHETLGLLQHDHASGNGFEHFEAAAVRAPNAARWLHVAETCADSNCVFAALNTALRVEPENASARLALANYYYGRNQLEKARDLLRQVIERDPGNFTARNTLADLYVTLGLNREALQESQQLEREFPKPLWLKRKLAARYLDFGLLDRAHALLTAGLRANFDDPQQRALLLRIYERRRDVAGLRSAYGDMLQLNPANASALAELAALDLAAGDYGRAQDRLQRALAVAPEDEDLRQRAANLLALAGKTEAAQGELARALEINPGLQNARIRLQLSSPARTADADAPYLENPAALAAQVQGHPPAANENAVKLADVRIQRVYENGLSTIHEQQIYYVANEYGVRQFSTRTVQYAPGSQELRVLHARVYKRDGRVLEGEEGSDTSVADGQAAMYYDVRSRPVHYPALEKGDVVELEYRITPLTNSNPYGNYFGELIVFRSKFATDLQRFVLIAPARQRFKIVEQRLAPAEIATQGHLRVYRWETRNSRPLANEPKGPTVTESAPYVHISSFQSWEELGRWYAQLIEPQFALDSALREQGARLVKNTSSELERIRAIHQFVLRNTHYVAMEFGIYSYKPYPVSQVYARRFGDCKDKASLMIALLRQAGIEAEIALVRTRRLGAIDPAANSVALFNHAIVYIPKYDLWLDGTAEYAGLRELPLEDQGAMALTVARDGHATLRSIPVTQARDNYTRRTVRAQVLPDGRIVFQGVTYTRGEDAPGLRREYESPERQRDAVRNALAEVLPSVKLESVRVDGANDFERPVTVEFRGTLDTFVGKRSVPLNASWMPRSYVQQLASLVSRSQDLLLPAPWTTEEELHFQLPPASKITYMPPDTTLETAFGTAALRYERSGRELIIRTSVQFQKLRISPGEYEFFRGFCQQVERAFQREIRIELRG
jgi:tetratricopeptide (TPR) repeat protein/transglutaminase-like putative cysteine protease